MCVPTRKHVQVFIRVCTQMPNSVSDSQRMTPMSWLFPFPLVDSRTELTPSALVANSFGHKTVSLAQNCSFRMNLWTSCLSRQVLLLESMVKTWLRLTCWHVFKVVLPPKKGGYSADIRHCTTPVCVTTTTFTTHLYKGMPWLCSEYSLIAHHFE